MNVHMASEPMSPDALEAALRAIGPVRYHDLHPFHGLLHDGKLNKGQVQAWALNRFVYQAAIPRKDASLIGRCEDRDLRREWLHRITDHDGVGEEQGGIDRWLTFKTNVLWAQLDALHHAYVDGAIPPGAFRPD
jgi:pyrroloquinoline-quinone synthase